MRLSLIAAMARNRAIGRDNQLPWRIPGDLAHFQALTLGKPLIMGRRTYESIGRPLPGRRCIILSRYAEAPEGCEGAASPEAALALCAGCEEVMIGGGAEIYRVFLPLAQRQYLTLVERDVEGDTFYPEYEAGEWSEAEREQHEGYCFVTLNRVPTMASHSASGEP